MENLRKILMMCLIALTLAMIYWCFCFRYEINVYPSGVARLDKLTGKVIITQEGEVYKLRLLRK